jgi:folate-binding protein YgfZ
VSVVPVCLSVEVKLFPIHSLHELQGYLVPWEVKGYAEDYLASESPAVGGFFDLTDWQTVEITGPDAQDYLQRMSTVNFREADPGRVNHGAFLTGKAQVICLGWFGGAPSSFFFLAPPPQGNTASEHIEKFHFTENLQVRDATLDWAVFALWSPTASLKTKLGMGKRDFPALHLHTVFHENLRFEIWRDDSRSALWWVKIRRRDAVSLLKWFHDLGMDLLGRRLFEFYRIKNAVPQVGVEASDKVLLLETGFDRAVARNKGCYPGQEVIERIFTYGSVNKKLLPVDLQRDGGVNFPTTPIALHAGGKEIGQVVSYVDYPDDPQRAAGLAYVHRQFWETKEAFVPEEGLRVSLRSAVEA